MLQEGQLFAGRYRIERRIAQGGMGAIFAAEHLATEERVALKVLFPHVLGSKSAVESFRLEARVTARIDSEHIVRVLDAGFDETLGVPFLAMELLRGLTLRELVSGTGPLAPAEVLVALRHVARALDKAHGYVDRAGRPAPIVHRDLKPANLFVSVRDGEAAFIKVLDFGLAKVLSESQLHSHEVKGTPLFMAREQFSHGPVTPQLDVWALGLIAFYLLAGRVYWLAGTRGPEGVAPLLNEILMQPLAPPSERALDLQLTPTWPVEFDAWFLRCLEPDPQGRFTSAGAAVEALVGAFASGAGLSETTIGAASSGLARRVTLGLESLQETAAAVAAAAAETTLPPASATHAVKSAELLADAPSGSTTRPPLSLSDSGTAPPSSVAAGEASAPPAGGRARGTFARARVFSAMVALGSAMALWIVLATRNAPRSEIGIASASAVPSRSEPDVSPPNAPSPSSSALASAVASRRPPAPASAEAPASVRPPPAKAPASARPPHTPAKSTKGTEAAEPKGGADDPVRAPPHGELPSPSSKLEPPPPRDVYRRR